MELNKDYLKNISEQLKIDIDESEYDEIIRSIEKITDKLDEILAEDTEGIEGTKTMAVYEANIFSEAQKFEDKVDFKDLNNFDGEYIRIKKETADEE